VKDPTDAMGDVLTPMSRVVSAGRHKALLERVAKLERALEEIARNDPMSLTPQEIAERALDGD
jgi:DNA-directed RNA polymerase subunit H (RpoH/RPB5)